MEELAGQLERHLDGIFAAYVVLCVVGAAAWWRTRQRALEIVLFVFAMTTMPLVYLGMFGALPQGFTQLRIFAPQAYLLVALGCCSVWPLLKRNRVALVAVAVAFTVNVVGYAFTRSVIYAFVHTS